jgi:hypothetical protein
MSVNLETGQFYDHENNIGGGVIDLIMRMTGRDRAEAMAWLRSEGLIEESKSASSSIVATYDYTDESDALLFQVCRFEPKTFRQRRPDGKGGWIWSLGETRRVLYRLPELAGAILFDETIFVVEGEKDVGALRDRNLIATCNPGGAGKWRAEYSESLRGADVIIVPDNDTPGREHAQQVVASLNGVAKRVRVLDLAKIWSGCPDKGDVSDWFAAGGTAEKLRAAVGELDDWKPNSVVNDASVVWPTIDKDAAYSGIAGEVVRTIEPHSEADPMALLIQFLVAVGSAIGRGPHYKVEGDYHYTKLFAVLVGATNDGRKGTSLGRVLQVMEKADPDWMQYRVQSGLVSGEGLIHHVRDPVFKLKDGEMVEVDRGVPDKRLLIDAQEFAAVLAVMEKPGNTLSPVTRDAWGHRALQTLGKVSPDKATGSHISIIAHITEPELRRKLTRTEMANGYANRFLIAKVRRSKKLPHGGHLQEAEIDRLGMRVKAAIDDARKIGRVTMTDRAAEVWAAAYAEFGKDVTGMVAEVTARAAPQVIRLALIYAALDNSTAIDVNHLRAAAAIWDYCNESAKQIFGDSIGDPTADAILRALRVAPAGMSRTDIRDLFARNVAGGRIDDALATLLGMGLARFEKRETGRRPSEVWFASGK